MIKVDVYVPKWADITGWKISSPTQILLLPLLDMNIPHSRISVGMKHVYTDRQVGSRITATTVGGSQ